ncbi:YqaJ viral recombinase family protein [Antrihabitans spumae]|uniref:YqaJ viral recombinase family protein n=1 Tax=Antrihabitans spumae TaxID=3373370 RepID=A0ABW7KMJ6_9NOCA
MIEPGSPEWLQIITPSKVAAILGVSRWESPYRLWHRMKGLVPPEPPADRFDVGHAAEQMLAELWRIQNPTWQLSRGEVQIRNDSFGFPTLATIDGRARRGALRRVVEFKSARTLDDMEMWGDDFTGDVPADYFAQLQWQMHVTEYTDYAAHLLAMGPYFKHRTYVVGYEPDLAMLIEEKCRTFHASLLADEPPDLDDSVPTYECVRQLNPNLEDRDAEIDPQLAADFLDADREYRALEAEYRGLKTRILDAMGNARNGLTGDLKVARRQNNGKGSISLYANKKTPTDQLRELIA